MTVLGPPDRMSADTTGAASGYVNDSVFSLMCARPVVATVVTPAPTSPRTGAGTQETRMV